ncbi:Putative DEAH-box ATP-dependent helicase [Sparassis crispa]|uniref:RNA helicase n=1 Tax=Sparassis crispa TaxID=139825 RepID=A0A401G511_9APHY|nr:Putative DEAH-box ATP-dependent helicase [Sparassis crispa]GBE77256.1 Putative DEAH-box ATP-dependent helicase [Sparassis crispa]
MTNKKTSEKESVHLEPHPAYISPSALEARHWGATYALYRFCNGIQLNRVLPAGPREYWNELAAEHKNAPEHQKWMYDADPFAARKVVAERQAKVAQKKEESSQQAQSFGGVRASTEFANAPEVKMAAAMRSFVEEAVKKAILLYPEAGAETLVLSSTDAQHVLQQLNHLGFTIAQARKALAAFSDPSPLISSLWRRLSPVQACIEYLILQVPECDLPQRFLPSVNSSNPFVTSTHSGTEDLKKRWIEDRAVKECGWPAHVVKECLSEEGSAKSWALLLRALNFRLIGEDAEAVATPDAEGDMEALDEDELNSFGAYFSESSQLVIPLPVAPMRLNVIVSAQRTLPTHGTPPPMYITSTSIAAYVRLHLVSKLLLAFKANTLIEPGESVFMSAVRLLEEEWAAIEDNGPPEMSVVLQYLMPQVVGTLESGPTDVSPATPVRGRTELRGRQQDDRTDVRVKEDFEAVRRSDEYASVLSTRQKLPAFASRGRFLKLLERNKCVVVVGETGCGKTTQLPQFILDSLVMTGHGSKTSIIVTQPRRLSAIGVASRVSAERLNDGSVGYAIRGESKQDKRTKLLFCTTGVVLRRLGSGDRLEAITHVIVDEVHERSVDGDFLLLELKELLKTRHDLKVILMSATINHETFMRYFDNAPLLTIPGFTHPVEDKYIEDFLPSLSYRMPTSRTPKKLDEGELTDELVKKGLDEECLRAIQSISRSDRIDYELIAALVKHIVSTAEKSGGILIFLPGVQEIRQCIDKLRAVGGARVLPLHANLSNDEQRLVFKRTSGWKIIAATNVAETSITIDDVIYVIDSGKVKETHYDPETGLTKLAEQWVTRAAARQRRGRAGRTQPGVCYKLYTAAQEKKLATFPIPEIQRVPLESIALTVKIVHHDVKKFLSRAIDPPNIAAMDDALSILEDLAATTPHGELTPLGRQMAMLPVDLRLGKMLILGTIFQCLGPILTIAACLSGKPLFVSPMEKREEASRARARFARGNSDLLTDMTAYDECMRLRSVGKSQSALRSFCEENFISPSTIREISSLRQDFVFALSDLGFIPFGATPSDSTLNTNSTNENLLKGVILGGLWPRIARVVLPNSAIKFDKVQAGTVQRDNSAREFRIYDLRDGRVFLHPASMMFGETAWRVPFIAYFQKQLTTKVFLRDVTEVSLYGLLLFGGPVTVNHIGGGLTVGSRDSWIKLKAWPRIGVLVNQLRLLLDVRLKRCIEEGTTLNVGSNNPVLEAMLALLQNDGMTA